MAETEKITINMSVVDLGKVDLLVDEGFFSTRTDFIRSAIRRQLDKHENKVEESITRKAMVMGVMVFTEEALKKRLDKNEKISAFVVGMLLIEDNVEPELADAVFESIQVYGVFRANKSVKQILADRVC
ncbi:MAG: CopG family transcriptional regulator [Chloroflexota bacterium]